jgi:uncharacterized protein YodC (DUF2158 family)
MALKIGDIVQLKSGGPTMTVTGSERRGVRCDWFGKDEDARCEEFPVDALIVNLPIQRTDPRTAQSD